MKKSCNIKYCFTIIVLFIAMIALGRETKAETYEDKFEYELKSGIAIITKYIGNKEAVAIPNEIAGTTKIHIEEGALKNDFLKKVVVLGNVKKIEKDAFGTKTIMYGKEDTIAEKYAKENSIEFRVYGDINGDGNVSATDTLKAKRHIVELSEQMLNKDEEERADLNCDGEVTATDMLSIKKVIVGLDESDEPEAPEEAEEDDDEHEDSEVPEGYVTLTYVTDPRQYPDIGNGFMKQIKKRTISADGYLSKDISQKVYIVPKDSEVNIINEAPEITANDGIHEIQFEYMWMPENQKTIYDRNWELSGLAKVVISGRPVEIKDDTTLYAYYRFLKDGKVEWDKPVIYLYPTKETEINVKSPNANRLTTSYPKYPEGGWRVLARPDGRLTDLMTNRELYCLYYEANNNKDEDIYKDGFVVKGEDIAGFLEEKLEILGLNEREAEEFIIYWLPILEKNKYNYIFFSSKSYIIIFIFF